jgi:hypothetical protein
MSTSSHFAYLIEKIRNSWSLLRMTLAKDSAVYYPERYYYSLSNLDAFALEEQAKKRGRRTSQTGSFAPVITLLTKPTRYPF